MDRTDPGSPLSGHEILHLGAHLNSLWGPPGRRHTYRAEVVAEACATGMPALRHVRLVHPGQRWPDCADDQFLFGQSFVVAPVLEPGATSVAAPPGRPAVSYPVGDEWGQRIRDRLT